MFKVGMKIGDEVIVRSVCSGNYISNYSLSYIDYIGKTGVIIDIDINSKSLQPYHVHIDNYNKMIFKSLWCSDVELAYKLPDELFEI